MLEIQEMSSYRIKNHYDFENYADARKFLMDDNTYVWGFNNNYAKSQIITSWRINYLFLD